MICYLLLSVPIQFNTILLRCQTRRHTAPESHGNVCRRCCCCCYRTPLRLFTDVDKTEPDKLFSLSLVFLFLLSIFGLVKTSTFLLMRIYWMHFTCTTEEPTHERTEFTTINFNEFMYEIKFLVWAPPVTWGLGDWGRQTNEGRFSCDSFYDAINWCVSCGEWNASKDESERMRNRQWDVREIRTPAKRRSTTFGRTVANGKSVRNDISQWHLWMLRPYGNAIACCVCVCATSHIENVKPLLCHATHHYIHACLSARPLAPYICWQRSDLSVLLRCNLLTRFGSIVCHRLHNLIHKM